MFYEDGRGFFRTPCVSDLWEILDVAKAIWDRDPWYRAHFPNTTSFPEHLVRAKIAKYLGREVPNVTGLVACDTVRGKDGRKRFKVIGCVFWREHEDGVLKPNLTISEKQTATGGDEGTICFRTEEELLAATSDNGSSSRKWTYYFDQESAELTMRYSAPACAMNTATVHALILEAKVLIFDYLRRGECSSHVVASAIHPDYQGQLIATRLLQSQWGK